MERSDEKSRLTVVAAPAESEGAVIPLGAPDESADVSELSRMTDDYMAFLETQDSAENESKPTDSDPAEGNAPDGE